MKQGRVNWALGCGLLGLLAAGCGSSDDPKGPPGPNMGAATADCGSVSQPHALTLKDVKPAAGTSVPNANIVQSFTIVGKLLKLDPAFARSGAHTAGASIPATTSWTYGPSGSDTLYATLPMAWTTPGHVELTTTGLFVEASGCVDALPNPMFSYDVTAP
jgi:hypothetical protein